MANRRAKVTAEALVNLFGQPLRVSPPPASAKGSGELGRSVADLAPLAACDIAPGNACFLRWADGRAIPVVIERVHDDGTCDVACPYVIAEGQPLTDLLGLPADQVTCKLCGLDARKCGCPR